MADLHAIVASNYHRVCEQVAQAAERAGRAPEEITIVGVCKYVGTQETAALVDAGCYDLGESRPQQLSQKVEQLATTEPVRWHLVGHLQRNKVARVLPQVGLIHGVDSERLLQAIDTAAERLGLRPQVLLEVNCSGDAAKHGFDRATIAELIQRLGDFPHVAVTGLMTMAARHGDAATAAKNFAALRTLREELAPQVPAGTELRELSMGMSGDFQAAIAEGATLVRIGSSLWHGLPDFS